MSPDHNAPSFLSESDTIKAGDVRIDAQGREYPIGAESRLVGRKPPRGMVVMRKPDAACYHLAVRRIPARNE